MRQALAALRLLLALTVVLGIAYPLSITAVAQLVVEDRADGSLVENGDGEVVGSELLGQPFDGDGWFHPRPDTFDGRASGASNLGPTNPELSAAVADRVAAVAASEGLGSDVTLPADAVTTSGSGLDPHISLAFARLQASRVAAARELPLETVLALIRDATSSRTFGFLGEPRVHVLTLNLALEEASP
jgi:potassium-transporting ATPase KdpC subunit